MKADLNYLKKELKRLADMQYLKKELNRIANEIKNFDLSSALTPQARQRLDHLERRFKEVLKGLADLQKQVDSNLDRFMKLVRKSKTSTVKSAARGKKKAAKKKTARKTTKRKAR
ncbi:MAG TPA: hypothetical protein VM432_10140 [Bdellovibrionales bacterium]|nr:hypothetical protein [Bdellovibrionales bacterium]